MSAEKPKEPNWPVVQAEIDRLLRLLQHTESERVQNWAMETMDRFYRMYLLSELIFVPAGDSGIREYKGRL